MAGKPRPPVRLQPLLVLGWLFAAACAAPEPTPGPSSTTPTVLESVPILGVADRGVDPSVVAIDTGTPPLCSGVLIAPDVVLTARRCVTESALATGCPAAAALGAIRSPPSLRILVGEDLGVAEERAQGGLVIVPTGEVLCGADLAVVMLDVPIVGVQPSAVRVVGAALGDRLRTVGFGKRPNASVPEKIARDQVTVVDSMATELSVGEACRDGPGALAMDEATGEIVGVLSRFAAGTCAAGGALDVYTRPEAFLALIEQGLSKSAYPPGSTRGAAKTKTGPLDMGAPCNVGADCAAGLCVVDRGREYCTRTCDTGDRCPTHYRCRQSSSSYLVCVDG